MTNEIDIVERLRDLADQRHMDRGHDAVDDALREAAAEIERFRRSDPGPDVSLNVLVEEYLAAIDADPVKDIWDTWDGKPKQGAEMTSSDAAWEEHGQNAARCLKSLRDALSEGRS